jgi:hypothetical protein
MESYVSNKSSFDKKENLKMRGRNPIGSQVSFN